MSEKEMFDPDPPTATDNLGIRTQSPLLAQILGAKLPPPPPKPPQDPEPTPPLPYRRPSGPILKLGSGRRP
jgi:hypothetical protein